MTEKVYLNDGISMKMKFADTLKHNRVIFLNDPKNPNSVFTRTMRHTAINERIWNLHLLGFFTRGEIELMIAYCNQMGFKKPLGGRPSIIRFHDTDFAHVLEKRLSAIGIIRPQLEIPTADGQKHVFHFARVYPVISVVMQIPGDQPEIYEPVIPLTPAERVVFTGIAYLKCIGTGQTNIQKPDGSPIEPLRNQADRSIFITDSHGAKLRESLALGIKYYFYFDVIYVNTSTTKKITSA
ncbi:hypothetical protein KDA11_05130 [Candidatus Saccharibacteria bacterium]|nr:hypothetical protein [Candidatus Saccharibacteria bacterium]